MQNCKFPFSLFTFAPGVYVNLSLFCTASQISDCQCITLTFTAGENLLICTCFGLLFKPVNWHHISKIAFNDCQRLRKNDHIKKKKKNRIEVK